MGLLLPTLKRDAGIDALSGFTDSSPVPLTNDRLVDTVEALLHAFVYPCTVACTSRDLLAGYSSHSHCVRSVQKTCCGLGTDRHVYLHEPQHPDLGSQQPSSPFYIVTEYQ